MYIWKLSAINIDVIVYLISPLLTPLTYDSLVLNIALKLKMEMDFNLFCAIGKLSKYAVFDRRIFVHTFLSKEMNEVNFSS